MRVRAVHVTPWLSRKGGGVAAAIWGFLERAGEQGIDARAVSLADPFFETDTARYGDIPLSAGQLTGPASIAFSWTLKKNLRNLGPADLIHVHSLRHWPGVAARREAMRRSIPLVISTHGGLYPDLLKHGRFIKLLSAPFERKNLRCAAMIHATSVQEMDHIRAYGVKAPIAVVPLGIDADHYTPAADDRDEQSIISRWPVLKGRRRILYLGFINSKKGLPRLAQAWGNLRKQFPDWHLVIAGPDDVPYARIVRNAVHQAGVSDATTFTGPIWDPSVKLSLLRSADLLVMPSDWENFGIVFGEALACEVPIIASKTAPWEQIAAENRNCGWWIDVGVEPLQAALAEAMSLSPEARREMGRRGRRLIVEQFAWPAQVAKLRQAYDYVLGGPRPAHVHLPDNSM